MQATLTKKMSEDLSCYVSDEAVEGVADEIISMLQRNKAKLIKATVEYLEPINKQEEFLLQKEIYSNIKLFSKYLGNNLKKNILSNEDKAVILALYEKASLSRLKIVGLPPNIIFLQGDGENLNLQKAAKRAADDGREIDAVIF